jgi:hypothetical protein
MGFGMDRAIVEEFLRQQLDKAWIARQRAADEYKRLMNISVDTFDPREPALVDGNYALRCALVIHQHALRGYEQALRAFTDFVLDGKQPPTDPGKVRLKRAQPDEASNLAASEDESRAAESRVTIHNVSAAHFLCACGTHLSFSPGGQYAPLTGQWRDETAKTGRCPNCERLHYVPASRVAKARS